MESKFFRFAAIAIFSLSLFAPLNLWAKDKKASEEILPATDLRFVISEPLEDEEAPVEETAEPEAAPEEEKPAESVDNKESRYTISAIEDPTEGKNYYITKDENDQYRFIQKLSWNKINDIKNYRITIERSTDDGWVQVLEKDLNENKIEVSLDAGQYRFQVSVINLFDQLEKSSAWQNFEVLKALQPSIENLQTDSMYLNSKKADGIFTLKGQNLTEDTIFTMEKKDVEPPKIIYGRILSMSDDGSSAQVQFDINQMDEGKYEIYAQNPGGLSVISKTLHIKNKEARAWRIFASAGYTLPFSFYDETLSHYADKKIFPISATAKAGLMAFHTKVGDFGFSADVNYTLLLAETKSYKMFGNYLTALGNLRWQIYIIPERLSLDIHAGAGVAMLMGVSFENKFTSQKSPSLNSFALAFGGGLGVQYHFGKHFYVEGNVDFIHAKFTDMNLGILYPSVSIGGMF